MAAIAASQGGGLLSYLKCFYIYILNNDNINYYYYIIILFYSFLVICNVFACGCQNEEGILAEKIKKLNLMLLDIFYGSDVCFIVTHSKNVSTHSGVY